MYEAFLHTYTQNPKNIIIQQFYRALLLFLITESTAQTKVQHPDILPSPLIF